jgi:hypothetical protein
LTWSFGVRVHPEYYSLLNLDYDGDVVHLTIIDGDAWTKEAQLNINFQLLFSFPIQEELIFSNRFS